jgi:hypothetical protein
VCTPVSLDELVINGSTVFLKIVCYQIRPSSYDLLSCLTRIDDFNSRSVEMRTCVIGCEL